MTDSRTVDSRAERGFNRCQLPPLKTEALILAVQVLAQERVGTIKINGREIIIIKQQRRRKRQGNSERLRPRQRRIAWNRHSKPAFMRNRYFEQRAALRENCSGPFVQTLQIPSRKRLATIVFFLDFTKK